MSRNNMYRRFCAMHSRCYDPKNAKYPRYGGRGIFVCERWHDFEAYYKDLGDIEDGLTVDRIDNDGPYAPENCRLATYSQQARNRSDTRILTLNGESRSATEWAEITGISRTAIKNRLKRGWSVEDALTIPVGGPGFRISPGEEKRDENGRFR